MTTQHPNEAEGADRHASGQHDPPGASVASEAPAAALPVLIVDDHSIFRSGLRTELDANITVLGEAATVDAAIALVSELQPRVVLLDVHLPGGRGGGGAEVIRVAAPRAPHTWAFQLRPPRCGSTPSTLTSPPVRSR